MAEEKQASDQPATDALPIPLYLPANLWLELLSFLSQSDCSRLYEAFKGRLKPPVLLKRSCGIHNFFQPPTSVTKTLIPFKSPEDEDELDTTYVTQLRNKKLLYCYADGNIGFYSAESTDNVLNCAQFLPPGKTTDVHELTDGRLIICQVTEDDTQEDDTNNELPMTFLVDLEANKSLELDLLDFSIKCLADIDPKTIFMGTTNGKLIQFDLEANKIVRLWPLTIPLTSRRVSKQPVVTEETELQVLSEATRTQSRPILCVAQIYSGGLFVVLDVENGFFSGLFDPEESEFKILQHYYYSDTNKIGFPVSRVIYDRYGKLTFIQQYDGRSSPQICDIENRQLRLTYIKKQPGNPFMTRAFVFPNGNLAFVANHHPDLNKDSNANKAACTSDSDDNIHTDLLSVDVDISNVDHCFSSGVIDDNDDSEDPLPKESVIEIQSYRTP